MNVPGGNRTTGMSNGCSPRAATLPRGSGRHSGSVPRSLTWVDSWRCHYTCKFFSETDSPGEKLFYSQLFCIHSPSKDTISWGIPPGFTLADNLLRNVQHLPYVQVNPRARCLGVRYTKLRPQLKKKSQTIIPRESGDQVLAGR